MVGVFFLLVALFVVTFTLAIKLYSITDVILYSIIAVLGMVSLGAWLYEVINYDK
jgi:Na+/H+ antiporter NhaA